MKTKEQTIGKKSAYKGIKFKMPYVEKWEDVEEIHIKLVCKIINKELRKYFSNLYIDLFHDNLSKEEMNKVFKEELKRFKSGNIGILTLKNLQEDLKDALNNNDINRAKETQILIDKVKENYAQRVSARLKHKQ